MKFVKSAEHERDFPTGLPSEVAIVGRSNVGKSSLINRISNNKKMAKVSKSPGCTKYINFFSVDNKFYIVDLPGYGFAKVSEEARRNWKAVVESYLLSKRNKAVLLLVDVSRGIGTLEEDMIEWLKYHSIRYRIIFTKIDKLKRNELREKTKAQSGVYLSSKTGEGVDRLVEAIQECLGLDDISAQGI